MSWQMDDFINHLIANGVNLNDELYEYLSSTNIARLQEWIKRLEKVRSFKVSGNSKSAKTRRAKQSQLIGKIFENLVRVILDGCTIMNHGANIRTTTSEIDFLIHFEPSSFMVPMFKDNGSHCIGEAKCIVGGMKTEWINELAGIMNAHNASLSILFTAAPPKKLRSEHVTAIAIQSATGFRVVPFGITQLNKVVSGENFLKILNEQYVKATSHSQEIHI